MSELTGSRPESRLWLEVLDGLETELLRAETVATGNYSGDTPTWDAPLTAPVLPEELVARTQDLLNRQGAMVKRLEEARLGVAQQLRYLRMDALKGLGSGPHFLDHRT